MLVDNFLKTQNLLNLAPNGKLLSTQELQSNPSSPGGAGGLSVRNTSRQLNLNGQQQLNNKVRRLAASMSSANIPELRKQNDFTPMANYNTAKQPTDSKNVVEMQVAQDRDDQDADPVNSKQHSTSELAKIQPTSALTIDHDMLVTKSET